MRSFKLSLFKTDQHYIIAKHTGQIMTTLISWLGVDQRGPTSIYLASDSRISWGAADQWNYGGKLFIAQSSPEAFGFCGDVLFPLLVLGPLCQRIDANKILAACSNFHEKLERIRRSVEVSFKEYPTSQKRPFQIFYISRTGQGMTCEFHAGRVFSDNPKNCKFRSDGIP